ncbi:hypothetical protein Pmani_012709 [Petrolisthes manimaculis]|uniref:Uncharacterized protein n=1 Tax=Petrolisthes manimaculis TaxID=1843537 RepID=A0AAE1PZX6_9EUCA|nr:hypothetical protein Pmani_012709 [Petrolisthes manimaculis]
MAIIPKTQAPSTHSPFILLVSFIWPSRIFLPIFSWPSFTCPFRPMALFNLPCAPQYGLSPPPISQPMTAPGPLTSWPSPTSPLFLVLSPHDDPTLTA